MTKDKAVEKGIEYARDRINKIMTQGDILSVNIEIEPRKLNKIMRESFQITAKAKEEEFSKRNIGIVNDLLKHNKQLQKENEMIREDYIDAINEIKLLKQKLKDK